jgi:hypothetical protein
MRLLRSGSFTPISITNETGSPANPHILSLRLSRVSIVFDASHLSLVIPGGDFLSF